MSASPDTYSLVEPPFCEGRALLYRGIRNADHRPVRIKILDPRSSRPKDVEQLRHEYEIGRLFDSPSVVRPLAFQTHQGMPALVMEDFTGTSLDHLIEGPMPVELFLTLASRIAAAVADIHLKDVVHRNLKPADILIGPAGDVKVGELGMASRLARGPAQQRTSRIEGALPYLSPEQTGRMNRSVDSRSDLYALGVIFYEMLTGTLPFQASDPLSWVFCHVARRPAPPSEIVPAIPAILSDIVLKLLAKLAEDRYQTARGLQHDLDACLASWRNDRGKLAVFPLGERDVSDRFEIAEKLYGREEETEDLFCAFERVVASGMPELVLVSGYSGIGKSSLVRELYRPIVGRCGLFVSVKFDQYKRDVPYFTFARAFGQLIEQLLAESEGQLARWKTDLQRALGASAQLIVDIIPQLELIIGPQPAIVPLQPLEAQNRFNMVFRQFVGVFAREEHPLALFLDDLQWLDSGSLKLIEDVLLHPQSRHLLVLGAYRDNEVVPSHPLMLTLDRLRKTDVAMHEVVLGPLDVASITQLVDDALHCRSERSGPLARLVHGKTAGNPFFVIQFLTSLYQEGLLEFDRADLIWRWDTKKIDQKGFTDNVVDLMARRLGRLPTSARNALKLAACVGSSTDLHTLAVISNRSEEQSRHDLWDAVAEGLVLRSGDTYTFLHDRVQQSAYSLIGEAERKEVHLEIGRLLLRSLATEKLEERVFDVVSQLNHGSDVITDLAERLSLARLDLVAGRKAKASIAYVSAREYLAVAASLLPADVWETRYDLALSIFMEYAECEYLSGEFERADALFELLLSHARDVFDKAAVYELRLKLCHTAGNFDESVAMGRSALHLFGVEIPNDDRTLEEATRAEVEAIRRALVDRPIAALATAPEATDRSARAIIGLLSTMAPGTYAGSTPRLFPFVIAKLVTSSLAFGPTYESCVGYSAYGLLLVSLFGDPRSAYEFSEMSIQLNQRLGDIRRRGTVLHLHGDHINFWINPIATDFPILERAFLACIDAGDLVFANFVAFEIVWQAIERGDTIDDVLVLAKKYAAFAHDSRNEAVYQTIRAEQQFLACLKGRTAAASSFEDDTFDEKACLAAIGEASFGSGIVFFHMMKLVAAYLAGDDVLAAHHAEEARSSLRAAMAMPMEATFYYFDALLLARMYPRQSAEEKPRVLEKLKGHAKKLAFWASTCPENFLTKHSLVAAEIARITGDELAAERHYAEASRSARANGFVHWQAIASELAGTFYRERGLEIVIEAHVREAVSCYRRWGADAKVEELELRYPELARTGSSGSSAMFAGRGEQLDLLSVVKASQTISGVMVQDELLRKLLQLVLEEGGARHACLVLQHAGELMIAAEAAADGPTFGSSPSDVGAHALGSRVPLSVLQYVLRTGQRIILDGAAIEARFKTEPYFATVLPRAAVCLPIFRQAEVVALLYLENDLVPGAFTPERLLALELLAAQAAISLENALLLERERVGRGEAESASRRAVLLAEGTALVSSSLDSEGMFAALTRLCVRSFADWAVIDVLEQDTIKRLAGAHRDPAKEYLVRELCERYPAGLHAAIPAAGVLRSGEPTHLPAIGEESLRTLSVDARHAEILGLLGTRSAIVVPLATRETTLGALTLASSSAVRFGSADVELAVELGRRIALAVDNARLLRETQRALRVREEFLSLASHELRTPLTSLQLMAEALISVTRGGAFSTETLERCLRRIVRDTQRLGDLSKELLDATLIDRGELSMRLAPVDLAAVVHDVVMRLEPDARAAGSVVSVSGEPSVVGTWDRSRLDLIVTNLLSNAIKFGAGRPVEVVVRHRDGSAQVVVEDHGIGIEQACLSRVFERFERGVPLMHYGGFGLGLYITRWLVRAHGGDVDVVSEPGVGSRFTVDLPCSPPSPSRVRTEQTPVAAVQGLTLE
ncbi:MAG TPA: AAA family ATPase [Labilithrix sp.]|nr:AAA family ATPase [Labilithrix sp.]